MFDDPLQTVDRIQRELLAEEKPAVRKPKSKPAPRSKTQDDRPKQESPPPPEKGVRGLVTLAFWELLGILLMTGWWMLWLR